MSMTRDEWNAWSPEKRKFYANLFTSYLITDDGMLRIDAVKRRDLVRAQLVKQDAPGSEQIIARSSSANYIIADCLEADGKTLKSADVADQIKVLCALRGDLATMQSLFPVAVDGQAEDPLLAFEKAEAAVANREPVQHSLVGGFKKPGQTIADHFADVVKVKMLNGQVSSAVVKAQLLSLGEINDLSFFSRCSLDLDEKQYLFDDPIFKEAIATEARRLCQHVMKGTMPAQEIEQGIQRHMDLCSLQKSNRKSLKDLNIPRVETYLAAFTTVSYTRLATYATNNLSVVGTLGFKPESKPGKRYLVDGLLEFTFPPEFRNVLKAIFLLKGPFAGQAVGLIKDQTARFVAQGDLVPALPTLLREITMEQIGNIKSGSLPVPPADMGIQWDFRRDPSNLLNILRNNQCLDLYTIAEIAGFSRENAHLAFGLESRPLVDAINREINTLWDEHAEVLLVGVTKAKERELADFAGRGVDVAVINAAFQPAGIKLAIEPPKAVVVPAAAVLKEVGLFAPIPVVPVPQANKTQAELAREAAQARLALRGAEAARKQREALLVARAPADEVDADEEERQRAARA